jgi:hypothetical protein
VFTTRSIVTLALFLVVGVTPPASAQTDATDPTGWGVAAGIVPAWKVPTGSSPIAKLSELVHEAGDLGMSIKGSDFRVGIVRGRALGGDWGVSYVRRTFKDGSMQGGVEEDCQDVGPQTGTLCSFFGREYFYQDVKLDGLEVNKFIPVGGVIKQRVQIGADIAIGFGALKGSAELRETNTEFQSVFVPPNQFRTEAIVSVDTSIVDAKVLQSVEPTMMGRAELAASVLLPRGLKVRFSGGLNFPGTQAASIVGMYFFGRR